MRIVRLSSALIFAAILSSCATAHSPVGGVWYTSAKGGIGAGAEGAGSKKGKACASSILGIIGTGDASVTAAARSGGISKVGFVDYSAFSILGLYAEHCTLVSGN